MKKLLLLLPFLFFACEKPLEDEQPKEINVVIFTSGHPYMVTGDLGTKMVRRDFSYTSATCTTPPFEHHIRTSLPVGNRYNVTIQRLSTYDFSPEGELSHYSFTVQEGCNALDVPKARGWN